MSVRISISILLLLTGCSCLAQDDEFSREEVEKNVGYLVKSLLEESPPSITRYRQFLGVGDEAELVLHLQRCLSRNGTQVRPSEAVKLAEQCTDDLMQDSSQPSLYLSLVRDLANDFDIELPFASIDVSCFDKGAKLYRVDVYFKNGTRMRVIHTASRQHQDLGWMSVRYFSREPKLVEVMDERGRVVLPSW